MAAWRPPGAALCDGGDCKSRQEVFARVRPQEVTIAQEDERRASRPFDFTTGVARSKTAIELMNERGESRCAEFTTRVARRVANVPAKSADTKMGSSK